MWPDATESYLRALDNHSEALVEVEGDYPNAEWQGTPVADLEDQHLKNLHNFLIRTKDPKSDKEKRRHDKLLEEVTGWDKHYNYARICFFQEKVEEELRNRGIDFEKYEF